MFAAIAAVVAAIANIAVVAFKGQQARFAALLESGAQQEAYQQQIQLGYSGILTQEQKQAEFLLMVAIIAAILLIVVLIIMHK